MEKLIALKCKLVLLVLILGYELIKSLVAQTWVMGAILCKFEDIILQPKRFITFSTTLLGFGDVR